MRRIVTYLIRESSRQTTIRLTGSPVSAEKSSDDGGSPARTAVNPTAAIIAPLSVHNPGLGRRTATPSSSVFVNPRRERTVEHVVAEVVDAEQHEQSWRSGDDVSDAHVLSEHASGSTEHTAAADPADTPPESHPYGQAHRP